MGSKVNPKSTKNEILAAYDDLLKKVQEKKTEEPKQIQERQKQETIVKSAQREEEEFQYNLKLTRKKEADLYEEKKQKLEKELVEKKAAFEKEFAEREIKIKTAEAELNELRAKAAAFPVELEKAVSAAVKTATEKLETTFRFEKELQGKETAGELKLKDQTIETLKNRIKDLEASLKEMSQKTITAEANVKDIAIKAIESSSAKPYVIEKNKENQAKD